MDEKHTDETATNFATEKPTPAELAQTIYPRANNTALTQDSNTNPRKGKALGRALLAIIALVFVVILVCIAVYVATDNKARAKYDDAIAKCGHDPIVYNYSEGFGAPPRWRLTVKTVYPSTQDKYYCTIQEALADGHSSKELNAIIPIEDRDLYR